LGCFLFCGGLAQAQFNLSVNYAFGYANLPNYNNIIDTYNSRQDTIKIGFDKLNTLNGIGLGLRYRFGFAALEFTWIERFRQNRAEGKNLEGNLDNRDLNYRYRTYGLTYTTFITDNISFGGSFNFDRFTMSTETTSELLRNFVNNNMNSSRFFVGISTEISDAAELSIQPFVSIPWGSFDFAPLHDKLNPGVPIEKTKEDMFHFGFSIIIYNGPQY
ncbi:MAG: hypothetical protein AAF738_02110, partial [Bacteroidota bacterium]